MTRYNQVRATLEKNDQLHLLKFYNQLAEPQQQLLLDQIEAIDFDQLNKMIADYVLQKPQVKIPDQILPPEIIPADGGSNAEAAYKLGCDLISQGKVAAFTVAGGQGTRLGYEGPKGCLPCTPIASKPLFRVFAEQIRFACQKYNVKIPWFILTSPINDNATKAHFRQNDYWGFAKDEVVFIKQGTMPAIDYTGKLILSQKFSLALSPDGHGGSLTALAKSGALAEMKSRGIEHISYFQVDNPLVHAIDPLFIGLHAQANAQASAKGLAKRDPFEKLGNFCVVDGKVTVIEYSDMPDELATQTDSTGRLKFSAGSIAIHLFKRDFIENLTQAGDCKLPLHRADKKVPFVNDAGDQVKPDQPNAVKLEMFVFDALPLAAKTVILETGRLEEFSPIKNKTGQDSLATSLHDQIRRAACWLENAGVSVPRDADGQIAAEIEISPLYASNPIDLAEKISSDLEIAPGQKIYLGSKGQITGA